MVILRATNENGVISDLDVLENDAPIKLDISAIENATIGDVFGASSQTFSLPGTDKNNQFFGNLFNLGATPAVALQDSIPCQVLTDGQEVFTGKLYITDVITDQQGYTTYQVNVVNETIDFKFKLTDTLLSELDWSAYNHNYTYNNITASWTDNLFSGSIVYPHVNYGTPIGSSSLPSYTLGGGARCFDNSEFPLQVNQFKPAIQVKAVLDEIFDSVDYKYTSSFIDSAYFENLYMLMTSNDGLGVYNANATTGSVWAFRDTSNQTFNALTSTKINFNAEVYDTYNRFDLVNDRYTAYTDGLYNFAVGFNYSISNYNVNNRLRFRVQLLKNGGTTGPSKNFVDVPQTGQIYAPFANIQLKNTDYVELFVELTTDDGTEVITIGFGQNATYFKVLGPQATGGGLVDMGLQFPNDMKALDFIQGLIEKFNLVVEPTSGFRNLLTIEPFTDWVTTGKTVDWTDKVDRSERFKIVHPITEQPKTIYFRDQDDEAVINKYNVDNFGDVFGSYIYENDSDLPIGEREIGKIFAATPVKGILNGDTMIIPSLCRKDNTGRELPFKFKPRLLYNNGLQDMPVTALGLSGSNIINPGNYFIIDESFVTHTEDQFLQMTTFEYLPTDASGSISGSRDLHFGNLNWWQYFQNVQTGKTTQDAYHVYWASYINSLYDIDARKLTCNVYLKPTELQGIQLNDKIFIDGAYYRINRINGANLSYRDSVEVELIKELNRLLPYPRRRVLNSIGTAVDIIVREIQADGNVVYEEYDGGVTVEDYGLIQQAGFKDSFAVFNNNNTGSVTWNIPASVTADQSRIAFGENQIDDSVGLVLVAGSNNTVQTQTENSLVNGSNNTLNAGSKNATIIGTNNTIDILTENVSILGATDSSVTGPNNNSVILGGTGSLLNNTDWAVMINGYNADIIDSDNTTAINSHDQEVIINGSGHTVIGLNREGAGLDLLNSRNNSNFLGDTYIGGGYLVDSFTKNVGDGTVINLTGSSYGDGKHETLYILNWNGLSPGTASINLPSAANSDYKGVVYTFKLASGNADEVVRLIPFDPAQTIDGATSYSTSGSYAFVSIHASGSKWHVIDSSAGGGIGPAGPSGSAFPFTGSAQITGSLSVTGSITATAGFTGSLLGTASLALCSEDIKTTNWDQPDPNQIFYYTQVLSTGSECKDVTTLDNFGLYYESNTNTHFFDTPLVITGSAQVTGSLSVTGSSRGNVTTMTISSGTASMDLSKGNAFYIFLNTGSALITSSNIVANQHVSLFVSQSGGNNLFFDSTFFLSGSALAYTASQTAGARDILTFETYNINPAALLNTGIVYNLVSQSGQPVPVLFMSASGGTMFTSGSYRIHAITGSGTFTIHRTGSSPYNVAELMVVAGGGGGNEGGGGAGGLIYSASYQFTASSYPTSSTITVGAGGAADSNGTNSIFFNQTSIGGGSGGADNNAGNPNSGGSGGGTGANAVGQATGSGTAGQGNRGSVATFSAGPSYPAGGGGGASQVGQNFFITASATGSGPGGSGSQYVQFGDITGTGTPLYGSPTGFFAGGGGGRRSDAITTWAAYGGIGGGGNGNITNQAAGIGVANTGGGGGGAAAGPAGGAGGLGIVIIKYQFQS